MKKEFKYKPMSKKNVKWTVLYGFLAVSSLVVLHSVLYFLIFAALTAANVFLIKRFKKNEAVYAEKVKKVEQALGGDLTDAERRELYKYCPPADDDEEESGKDKINAMMKRYAEEDAMYEALEAYEDSEALATEDYENFDEEEDDEA